MNFSYDMKKLLQEKNKLQHPSFNPNNISVFHYVWDTGKSTSISAHFPSPRPHGDNSLFATPHLSCDNSSGICALNFEWTLSLPFPLFARIILPLDSHFLLSPSFPSPLENIRLPFWLSRKDEEVKVFSSTFMQCYKIGQLLLNLIGILFQISKNFFKCIDWQRCSRTKSPSIWKGLLIFLQFYVPSTPWKFISILVRRDMLTEYIILRVDRGERMEGKSWKGTLSHSTSVQSSISCKILRKGIREEEEDRTLLRRNWTGCWDGCFWRGIAEMIKVLWDSEEI